MLPNKILHDELKNIAGQVLMYNLKKNAFTNQKTTPRKNCEWIGKTNQIGKI